MRTLCLLLFACSLPLLGCAGLSVVGGAADAAGGGDAHDDLSSIPTFDIPSIDAVDVPPDRGDVEVTCTVDLDCARGQRCLQGRCAEDVCLADENACGNDRCQMECVPVRDPCAGVRCEAGQTCFGGVCISGCFPSPCAGIECPTGSFCNPGTGACARITPCPGRCNDGYACHIACTPRTPCDSMVCPAGQACVNGTCVPSACAGVSCAPGLICVEGRCVDTCACATPCNRSPRDRCLLGQCTCERTCTPTSPCGADDGCGGHCLGPCPLPNATCNPVTFSCDCVPRCNTDTSCGGDDGCGGHCSEGCAAGERCDATLGHCVCIPRCPPPEAAASVPCALAVHNICPDGPVCGTGTMCPPGTICSLALSRCLCVGEGCGGPSDGGAGMMDAPPVECPVGLSACRGMCVDTNSDRRFCGDCLGECPMETSCVNGRCVCPPGLALCGTRCVNTQTESGNCGTCGTQCVAGTSCQGGRCRCATTCTTDLNVVACGVEVPSPCPGGASCGFGRACPDGQVCDVRTRACVCVPRCPAGVRCGVSDGCGGQCIGGCDTGSTCTQDPVDPRRFFCSSAGCTGGCRCDEVCAMNRCTRVTCPGGGNPCPCQCCPINQTCVGGSTCVPIPP